MDENTKKIDRDFEVTETIKPEYKTRVFPAPNADISNEQTQPITQVFGQDTNESKESKTQVFNNQAYEELNTQDSAQQPHVVQEKPNNSPLVGSIILGLLLILMGAYILLAHLIYIPFSYLLLGFTSALGIICLVQAFISFNRK